MLPENPPPPEEPTVSEEPLPEAGHTRPRVRLLVTEKIKSAANRFGISRLFKRRPLVIPPQVDLDSVYAPTAMRVTASRTHRSVSDIIAPYPNFSAFLMDHHFWLRGGEKSQAEHEDLRKLLIRPDFKAAELQNVNFAAISAKLSSEDDSVPWAREGEGWKESTVTLAVPSGKKPTQASRRAAATLNQRASRHETIPDQAADDPLPGDVFTIPGFFHKNLCAEIKAGLETDSGAARFVYDPCLLQRDTSVGQAEGVHGELYHSPEFVEEDLRLQNSPAEPGCNLPRAIAALMFWSDATHVTQFGNTKMWPAYMYFGNQSKYERARPTCNAAHHVAFFSSVS